MLSPSEKYSSVSISIQYNVATAHISVIGYRWLYEVPRILHRDISLNNLMLRKEDGNVYAVLNDLDLAVDADAKSQSSKHRTGTKPFMAIDLLSGEPTDHLYRHDLESLFFVLVWITARHDGEDIPKPPLKEWAEGDHQRVMESKSSFLLKPSLIPTKRFASLELHISRMHVMFRQGHVARSNARDIARANSRFNLASEPETSHFDDVTLGGLVTFDAFQSILDADLPICSASSSA